MITKCLTVRPRALRTRRRAHKDVTKKEAGGSTVEKVRALGRLPSYHFQGSFEERMRKFSTVWIFLKKP